MRVGGMCVGGPHHGKWKTGYSILGLEPKDWPKAGSGGAYVWNKSANHWDWYIKWWASE